MSGAISPEQAIVEFERFATKMRLDLDPGGMDADDKKSLDGERRRFLRAVEQGQLIVDADGQPVFTPLNGEPITFHQPIGGSLMAMDDKKPDKNITKGLAMMAQMTRLPLVRYHDMPYPDLRVCQAIVALFLG